MSSTDFKRFNKQKIQDALETPYDPNNDPDCDLISETVQEVIEEICNKLNTSASPGFTYGRSGNLPADTWLLNETVPSNISGRWIFTNNTSVTEIYVGTENVDTFDIALYYHDGDEVGLTFVGSVSIVAATGGKFSVNFPVVTDKQLGVRIINGSAKNAVVGLQLEGTI